jgi:hypothetical protein
MLTCGDPAELTLKSAAISGDGLSCIFMSPVSPLTWPPLDETLKVAVSELTRSEALAASLIA